MLFAHWQSNTDLQIFRVSCAAISLAVAGSAVSLVTAGQKNGGDLGRCILVTRGQNSGRAWNGTLSSYRH